MSRDAHLKSFHGFILHLDGGRVNEQLTEAMQKIVIELSDACLDRAGTHKATLNLKLDFEMNHKDKIVTIYADVTDKLPKAPKDRVGMFWCDADGNLVRENPRQATFDDELERQRKAKEEKLSVTA